MSKSVNIGTREWELGPYPMGFTCIVPPVHICVYAYEWYDVSKSNKSEECRLVWTWVTINTPYACVLTDPTTLGYLALDLSRPSHHVLRWVWCLRSSLLLDLLVVSYHLYTSAHTCASSTIQVNPICPFDQRPARKPLFRLIVLSGYWLRCIQLISVTLAFIWC
jgi:hypothetical protein